MSFNVTIIIDNVLEDNETFYLSIVIPDVLRNIIIPGKNDYTVVTIVNDGGTGIRKGGVRLLKYLCESICN